MISLSDSDIFSTKSYINELLIIGQCDVKHTMTFTNKINDVSF